MSDKKEIARLKQTIHHYMSLFNHMHDIAKSALEIQYTTGSPDMEDIKTEALVRIAGMMRLATGKDKK